MVRKYIAFWAPKEIYSAHFFKKCFWASFCGRWQGVAESKCASGCHFAPWAVAAGSAYSESLDNQVPVRLLCAACSERVPKGRGTRSVYFPYAPGTGKADARLTGIVRQAEAGLAAGSFLPLGWAAAGGGCPCAKSRADAAACSAEIRYFCIRIVPRPGNPSIEEEREWLNLQRKSSSGTGATSATCPGATRPTLT